MNRELVSPVKRRVAPEPTRRSTAMFAARPQASTSMRRMSGYTARPAELIRRDTLLHRGSSYQPRSIMGRVSQIVSKFTKPAPQRTLALLLPGHNEELIIAHTIQSAVKAGQALEDIYVVDDNSDDRTREIALSLLGESNVLTVGRSGKAMAVRKAIAHFEMEKRYRWVHVADADSIFGADYFNIFRSNLSDKYVVAIGFVQSLKGNWISTYRAISYTYGQQVFRRIQDWLGMIAVFPGPVTCFRTDILKDIDINTRNIAEDFDMTLQVHRKNLGKIKYIPKAVNYTQDPQSFKDFRKQSMRWYRGFFQGITQHRIGTRAQRIDISIGFQLIQTFIFLIQILFLFPLVMYMTHDWLIAPAAIAIDFIATGFITLCCSIAIRRWYLIGALPYFYILRLAEITMYFTAFVEIVILKKFSSTEKGWGTEGRRYKISSDALQEAATAA